MKKRFEKPSYGHKSYNSAFNGVIVHFKKERPNYFKAVDAFQYWKKLGGLMRKFLSENNLEYRIGGKHSSLDYNANVIQENWILWKEYVSKLPKKQIN